MEEPYKSRVLKNIFNLTELTDCDEPLLAYLQQKNVLTTWDIAVLRSSQVSFEKSRKLYDILLKRPGSYEPLIAGLLATQQLGAVQILDPSPTISDPPSTRPSKYSVVTNIVGGRRSPSRPRDDIIDPKFTSDLEAFHKLVIRSNWKGKPLLAVQPNSNAEKLHQLCLKYSSQYHSRSTVRINASEKKFLMEDFVEAAETWKIKVELEACNGPGSVPVHVNESNIGAVAAEVYKYFMEKKCLFIFENVNLQGTFMREVLPPTAAGYPTVLITSVNKSSCNELDATVVAVSDNGRIGKTMGRKQSFFKT